MSGQHRCWPIIEAICEFRFDPTAPWDGTIPGMLYAKLKGTFPDKQQARIDVRRLPGAPPVQAVERMQFYTSDRTALVQVNEHFLSVNHLAPYTSWEEFRPLVEQSLEAYVDVAQPKGLRRLGLRYINRIVIPGPRAEMAQYFRFHPRVESGLPQDLAQFQCRIVAPFPEEKAFLHLQLLSQASPSDAELRFLLDLDIFTQECTVSEAPRWADAAHQRLDEVFRACITDKTRDLFIGKGG